MATTASQSQSTPASTNAPPSSEAGAAPPRARGSALVLVAGTLGFVVTALDALAVNVALPAVGHGLGGGTSALQWIVDAYTLMYAALLLSAGSFSDRFGASRAFGAGLAVFTAASAACGLAPTLGFLIGARLVQGAAAAVVLPASLALVRQAFPEAGPRARAIAVWTAGGAVAAAAGPVVGGVLTSSVGWRTIFFVNLPVGVVGLALLARAPRSPRRRASLDLPGQLTVIVGLGALTFGVIEGGASGFGRSEVLASLLVAAAAAAAFAVIERRAAEPMVPLGLFRTRSTAVSLLVGFAINVVFYGLVFVLGLYFQTVLGLSAIDTGLMFLPMTGLVAVANMASVRAAARFGPWMPIAVGQLICAAGLLAFLPAVGSGIARPLLALMLVPAGVGPGFAIPSVTAAMLSGLPPERAGLAGGAFNSARQTGGAVSIALFGALVAHRATFLAGLRLSLLIATVLMLASAAAALALPRNRPRTR